MSNCKTWIIRFNNKRDYHTCLVDPQIISQIRKKEKAIFINQKYEWKIILKKRFRFTGISMIFFKYEVQISPSDSNSNNHKKKQPLQVQRTSSVHNRGDIKYEKEERVHNQETKRKRKVRSKEDIITTKLWKLCLQLS